MHCAGLLYLRRLMSSLILVINSPIWTCFTRNMSCAIRFSQHEYSAQAITVTINKKSQGICGIFVREDTVNSVALKEWQDIWNGVGPSERNPVRTKASFDLMGHMFSFCWAFVPMGFRSSGIALCSVLPTDCNEIY